jgi:hypothetical protein
LIVAQATAVFHFDSLVRKHAVPSATACPGTKQVRYHAMIMMTVDHDHSHIDLVIILHVLFCFIKHKKTRASQHDNHRRYVLLVERLPIWAIIILFVFCALVSGLFIGLSFRA